MQHTYGNFGIDIWILAHQFAHDTKGLVIFVRDREDDLKLGVLLLEG